MHEKISWWSFLSHPDTLRHVFHASFLGSVVWVYSLPPSSVVPQFDRPLGSSQEACLLGRLGLLAQGPCCGREPSARGSHRVAGSGSRRVAGLRDAKEKERSFGMQLKQEHGRSRKGTAMFALGSSNMICLDLGVFGSTSMCSFSFTDSWWPCFGDRVEGDLKC